MIYWGWFNVKNQLITMVNSPEMCSYLVNLAWTKEQAISYCEPLTML